MTMDEEREGIAAEYALGTLDADERAQADAMLLVDPDFAAAVGRWERRLGELNVLVAPVEPPAPVWDRIRAGVAEAAPAEPMRLPELAAPPVAAVASRAERRDHRSDAAHAALARPDRDERRACGLRRRHRGGARIPPRHAAGRLAPEAAGGRKDRGKAGRGGARGRARSASARPAQFVAVFQKDEQSPAFLMSVDTDKRSVTVRQVAAERLADKSYQLWIATAPGARAAIARRARNRRLHGAGDACGLRSDGGQQRDVRDFARAARGLADRTADRAGHSRQAAAGHPAAEPVGHGPVRRCTKKRAPGRALKRGLRRSLPKAGKLLN